MPTKTKANWVAPAVRENLSDQAYAGVRRALMHAELMPNETLNLRPIAKLFNISVTPMREALLRLVSENVLAINDRGTIVVPALTLDEMLEIQTIRIDLEGRAAFAAASTPNGLKADVLENLHNKMLAAKQQERRQETLSWNARFHLELCRYGEAPITYEIIENLWVRCGPSLIHLFDVGTEEWIPHPHLEVIAALRAGDGERARAAISQDIKLFRKRLETYGTKPES